MAHNNNDGFPILAVIVYIVTLIAIVTICVAAIIYINK